MKREMYLSRHYKFYTLLPVWKALAILRLSYPDPDTTPIWVSRTLHEGYNGISQTIFPVREIRPFAEVDMAFAAFADWLLKECPFPLYRAISEYRAKELQK